MNSELIGAFIVTLGLVFLAFCLGRHSRRPTEEPVSSPTKPEVTMVKDVYTNLVNLLPAPHKELLSTLYVVVYDDPATNIISALSGVVNVEDSKYKLILTKLISQACIYSSPAIIEQTLFVGKYIADLNGVDLDTFSTDIKVETPIEDPALLLALTIIILHLAELKLEEIKPVAKQNK